MMRNRKGTVTLTAIDQQLEEIVIRAHRVRKSIRKICLRAGVAPSTWSRWRGHVVEADQATIDRLKTALAEFENEAAEAA